MSWSQGLWWPFGEKPYIAGSTGTALDATGEYVAIIGRISIDGRATGKTLNTTGSSSIRFWVSSAPVFDATGPASEFTVGFRGVDKTTGFPVRPDAAWTTAGYARAVMISDVANTTPALTDTSATGHVIVPTAGTITLDHGDEVCFMFEMTTRSGSDAVSPVGMFITPSFNNQYPAFVSNTTGSVAGVSSAAYSVVVTFSDGTLGTIDGTIPGDDSNLQWSDSTNPDEQGIIFQVPFACKIDALYFPMRLVDAASDMQYDLVSDPTGSPTSLIGGPIAFTAENLGVAATAASMQILLDTEVSLLADTDYCLAVKATSTSVIRWNQIQLGEAASRTFIGPGGMTTRSATRNGGSGAYTAGSQTLINPLSVRISEITTGGGGIITHPGMAGGMRG